MEAPKGLQAQQAQPNDQGQQQQQQQADKQVQLQGCPGTVSTHQEAPGEADGRGHQPERSWQQDLQEQQHMGSPSLGVSAACQAGTQGGQTAGPYGGGSKSTNLEAAVAAAGHPAPVQEDLVARSPVGHDWPAEFGAAPLLYRLYDGNDHFWLQDCSRMAEEVVGWLEAVALLQAA